MHADDLGTRLLRSYTGLKDSFTETDSFDVSIKVWCEGVMSRDSMICNICVVFNIRDVREGTHILLKTPSQTQRNSFRSVEECG